MQKDKPRYWQYFATLFAFSSSNLEKLEYIQEILLMHKKAVPSIYWDLGKEANLKVTC